MRIRRFKLHFGEYMFSIYIYIYNIHILSCTMMSNSQNIRVSRVSSRVFCLLQLHAVPASASSSPVRVYIEKSMRGRMEERTDSLVDCVVLEMCFLKK